MTVNVLARQMGRHTRPGHYEVCASRGPRIGAEDVPYCTGPRGTRHVHRGWPGSGLEHETWSDLGGSMLMRDEQFASEWARVDRPLDLDSVLE